MEILHPAYFFIKTLVTIVIKIGVFHGRQPVAFYIPHSTPALLANIRRVRSSLPSIKQITLGNEEVTIKFSLCRCRPN